MTHTTTRPPGERSACPQTRLRWLGAGLVAALALVMARVSWVLLVQGPAYRHAAAQPLVETVVVPAARGRILSREGTVLAWDEPTSTLAVHYRWLQTPADPAWVRSKARAALPPRARRSPERLRAAEAQVRTEHAELQQRLATLGVVTAAIWNDRTRAIQSRVERIADEVHQRRLERHRAAQRETDAPGQLEADVANRPQTGWRWWRQRFTLGWTTPDEDLPPPRIVVSEQLSHYPVAEGLTPAQVASIEGRPELYPGVRIETKYRRRYPRGELAAHVLGHVGRSEAPAATSSAAEDNTASVGPVWTGMMGVERQYDALLRGTPGRRTITKTRSGDERSAAWQPPPIAGQDVMLTLDVAVQAQAEAMLDQASPSSGAIVVLEVETGALLASASAPRFLPEAMVGGTTEAVEKILRRADQPLFDRAGRMALPPGGALRPLVAAALLSAASPDQLVQCDGEVGCCRGSAHGEVNLPQALAVGCDSYFAAMASEISPETLATWLRWFGLGITTGLDLPGEAEGRVPQVTRFGGRNAQASVDARALALGQGQLLTTPVQLARAVALLANGGRFVCPHVARNSADSATTELGPVDESRAAPGDLALDPAAFELIAAGMVEAQRPKANGVHLVRYDESTSCAGICASAQVDGPRRPHRWFVGYAPVDEPRVAVVVAWEHTALGEAQLAAQVRGLLDQLARQGHLGAGFVPAR